MDKVCCATEDHVIYSVDLAHEIKFWDMYFVGLPNNWKKLNWIALNDGVDVEYIAIDRKAKRVYYTMQEVVGHTDDYPYHANDEAIACYMSMNFER